MTYAVTYPDTLEMIVGEKFNLTVDFSGVLGSANIVGGTGTVIVTNTDTDETVPSAIIGAVTASSKVLSLTLSSANLMVGNEYEVSFTCATSGLSIVTIYLTVKVIA